MPRASNWLRLNVSVCMDISLSYIMFLILKLFVSKLAKDIYWLKGKELFWYKNFLFYMKYLCKPNMFPFIIGILQLWVLNTRLKGNDMKQLRNGFGMILLFNFVCFARLLNEENVKILHQIQNNRRGQAGLFNWNSLLSTISALLKPGGFIFQNGFLTLD